MEVQPPTATKRRPTMLDVARLAGGVHPSTVSLVLRNSPSISEATRKRVMAAVRKVGYRRDPLLDAYNHHRMGVIPHKAESVIACISELPSKDHLERHEPHRSLLRGARAAAAHLHCKLEIFLTGPKQLSPERLDGILHARGISAVLLLSLNSPSALSLTWEDFSAVRIDSQGHTHPRLAVATDQRQAARLTFERLSALGYKRIGLILNTPSKLPQQELALAGFLIAQASQPSLSALPPLFLSDSPPVDGKPLQAWLKEHKPDAVVCENAETSTQLTGGPFALAALDVTAGPSSLAGIQPDHERVGAQAVEHLVSLMRTNQRGSATTEACTHVPVAWKDGTSAPPLSPTKV